MIPDVLIVWVGVQLWDLDARIELLEQPGTGASALLCSLVLILDQSDPLVASSQLKFVTLTTPEPYHLHVTSLAANKY